MREFYIKIRLPTVEARYVNEAALQRGLRNAVHDYLYQRGVIVNEVVGSSLIEIVELEEIRDRKLTLLTEEKLE